MDSFIFKGKSSLEFENLVVCNIPPIIKPPKRTEIIEIDGKDGNIINELGYRAYEKEVTLFRKGDIDVDKLAEWLNGTGKLIFSNEEDKYYNATIINQIDFPRFINYEYIKVIFQIQPFKYSNLDENIIFNCKSVLDRCTIASINAAVGKLKNVKVYGKLEQETRSGKNLLHINNTSSLNGVIFTNNENGTITINGTATASGDLWIANGYSYLADTYKRSFSKGEKITQSRNIISGTYSGTWYMRTITYDIDNKVEHWADIVDDMTYKTAYNGETRGVEIYIVKGTTFNNLILFPQLEIGDTATTPEEYGVMPSPNYPSKIKVISRIDYKSVGKNVLPNSATTIASNGLTFTVNSDGSITITGTSTARTFFNINSTKRIKLQQCKYTLSKFGDTNNLIETYLRKGSVSELLASIAATNSKITFTNNYIDEVFVYIAIPSGVTINETISIQLETGTEQTEYEPYKEIVETITLPENEFMGKIGTYEDYIEGNILHKRIGKLVLDGTENWSNFTYSGDSGGFIYYITISDCKIISINSVNYIFSRCSHFTNKYSIWAFTASNIGEYSDHGTTNRKYFLTEFDTVSKWKSYLAEQYANGTPVEIYYVLAEEYTVELDRFELPLLEGINNISSDSEIEAEYYNPKKLSVNNVGLQKSLPIIKLKGEGISSLYVNSIEQFIYKFPTKEDNSVIIDSIEQEAYYEGILKNRNMNGEFPELLPGINEVTWSGDVDEFEINPKSRWL